MSLRITRTIWILSLVSLFTDTASEMLYPVMPLYLKQIGFSVLIIGILEGLAEATAGLSKGYFGKWSDNLGKRLPFVQLGYSLSAISKPLMVLFRFPVWVFFARTLDKLGKGLRTGARDAILANEATQENRGRIFGFHRAMDTLGAAIGPAIALVYLAYHPQSYVQLFYISLIPGILAVVSTFLVKEKKQEIKKGNKLSWKDTFSYWKSASQEYRKIVLGFTAFAIVNSSDVFLLLKVKEAGISDQWMIGLFIFYNLIYALLSYPLGQLADRIGLKPVYIIGLMVFALVYLFFIAGGMMLFVAGFVLYGLFYAATYGIAKAWISNVVPREEAASALGTFSGFQSVAALLASSIAGIIWQNGGSTLTFAITAVGAFLVGLYFILMKKPEALNS
ncbi:MAG: MFS transporter [Bacteroidetes bacterium]|nr:MFS transporter [Bacteroidota bacterium]